MKVTSALILQENVHELSELTLPLAYCFFMDINAK